MLNKIKFNKKLFPIIKECFRTVHSHCAAGIGDGDVKLHKTPAKSRVDSVPLAKYGGRYLVTMVPGAGIGPEMNKHIRDIFKIANVPVDFEIIDDVDEDCNKINGNEVVNRAVTSIQRNGIGIKGNLENIFLEDDKTYLTPNVVLRNKLDLYVYLLHYKTYPGIRAKCSNLDLILIRQNTEGEYAMLEHESINGLVHSLKIVTETNVRRVAEFAFDYARKHQRKKVTAVHNAKCLDLSDGLFLEIAEDVAKCYPDLIFEEFHVDRTCCQLVQSPEQFDVLLMPNLYGTIISNIICGLAGGPGLYSGTNIGSNYAVFESAVRQTALDLKDRNIANPTALLNASVDMLEYLGEHCHAQLIRNAIEKTLVVDKIWTSDIGGECCTNHVIDSIKRHIEADLPNYEIF